MAVVSVINISNEIWAFVFVNPALRDNNRSPSIVFAVDSEAYTNQV